MKELAVTFLAVIFIVVSVLTPIVGFFVSVSNLERWETNYYVFPFAIIPALLSNCGIILKKLTGEKLYTATVVIGILMALFTLVIGCLAFGISHTVPFDSQTQKAEEYLGIELPEKIHVYTQGSDEGNEASNGEMIYYISTVYFEDEAAEEFEAMIVDDDRWLKELAPELLEMLSVFSSYSEGENAIIYNVTEHTINTPPSESGSYRIITFSYSTEDELMNITEYDLEYVK